MKDIEQNDNVTELNKLVLKLDEKNVEHHEREFLLGFISIKKAYNDLKMNGVNSGPTYEATCDVLDIYRNFEHTLYVGM